MGKNHILSTNEKELLNALGRFPDASMKELLTLTNYKQETTVARKVHQFKEQMILQGPAYDLNYSKLCKNPLHKLYCILETTRSYETVVSYTKLIEPLRLIFPALSPHEKILVAVFYSSNDKGTVSLLELLKDNTIITDYTIHVWCSKRIVENPDFFGDPTPSLDNLLDPCDIPDMSLECHDTDWNTCDITVIPYLRFNDTKLVEILRKEEKLHRSWTYEQVRYSREKMLKNRLIEKKYAVFPFSPDQSTLFDLFLKSDDTALTQRILYNFARNGRVYKEYVLCEDGAMIICVCHHLFLRDVLHKLDQVNQIKEKELYPLRSVPTRHQFARPIVLEYYDFDKQTLEYPYRVYREKIKEKSEREVS